MSLVQVTKSDGVIERVKPGTTPVLELHLDANQRVISVDLHESPLSWSSARKTVDWWWTL